MKPHKGKIADWYVRPVDDECYVIQGRFEEHPEFAGLVGHTSRVLGWDKATGEIETRNSRYTLV